jgi:hypothetical protein
VLDALAMADHDPTRNMTLEVSGTYGKFCWIGSQGPTDYAHVVGPMVAMSATLRKLGIAVLDECENDVFSSYKCSTNQ